MRQPGESLGHYEILAHLGTGAMGEVYRARDTTLGRDVAIKLLRPELANDARRLARLEREANLLAAVDHTGVARVYSLEHAGDERLLVMELVEGETLAAHLEGGPVPVVRALELGRQLAEALEAAHRKGVLHRDLKPANVMVTPNERVVVLDFGIAKSFDTALGAPGEPALSSSTASDGVGTDMVLGTPAYMSPEQARCRELDKRTDVWSFGCVLFELLAGRKAFGRETVSDTVVALMSEEPAWESLPTAVPQPVRVLLRRCLERDAGRRLRDIGDAAIELRDALNPGPEETPVAHGPRTWPWIAAAALGVIVLILAAANLATRTPPSGARRFDLVLPAGTELAGPFPSVAISRAGTHVAFTAVGPSGRGRRLYLRALDALDSRPLPGTESAAMPFFSPDGAWIGFTAGEELRKVPVDGGPVTTVAKGFVGASRVSGSDWAPDGTIWIGRVGMPLSRVPDSGGTAVDATAIRSDDSTMSHRHPQLLPDGRMLYMTDHRDVVIESKATGDRRVVLQSASSARYVASGHLVDVREGTLMAMPFDLKRTSGTGEPVPVFTGVLQNHLTRTSAADFAASDDGTLVYAPGGLRRPRRSLVWVNRDGTVAEPLAGLQTDSYRTPRISPDGTRIAYSVDINTPGGEIWIYDIARSTPSRLTFAGNNSNPVWMADGTRVAYRSERDGLRNIWHMPTEGGPAEQLTYGPDVHVPQSWSPTGELFFYAVARGGAVSIEVLSQSGERWQQGSLSNSPYVECEAAVSPNGRWLAYTSDKVGRQKANRRPDAALEELYLRPLGDEGKPELQISNGGAFEAMWSRDGRELYFRDAGARQLMVVDVVTEPRLAVSAPRPLFEDRFSMGSPCRANYDVAPDGRFLMVSEEPWPPVTQLQIVVNWFSELERLVPRDDPLPR